MRNIRSAILGVALLAFLAACGQTGASSQKARLVEQHLQALVARDEARYSATLCESWTADAFIEYDALSNVQPRLENVACVELESSGDRATVQCSGEIVATYGNEVQRFPLSGRIYQLELHAGDWLVCGYTR